MSARSETYCLTELHSPEWVEQLAPGRVALLSQNTKVVRYFDTFDWRLYRKGLALVQAENEVQLLRVSDGEIRAQTAISPEGRFWWMFPKGALRDILRDALSVRALLLRAKVRQEVCAFQVLNADEKTVVRLFLTHTASDGAAENARAFFTLREVRGYEREFEALRRRVAKLDVARLSEGVFERVAGCAPGDYSSKLDLDLNPKGTGREAICDILKCLRETTRQNEAGIRADWDTEFLHDFRVAIRRTRSALSQIKGVLPNDAVDHFKAEFRQLGKSTNRLRDLDVYLLKEETYRAMLPPVLQPGLDAVFARIKREREHALQDMVQVLDSPEYRGLMASWTTFLQGGQEGVAPAGDTPVVALARGFVWKHFRRVLKRGKAIEAHTPDEALHDLRIDCKKLRYLLEFFASFFPKDKMDELIGHLKKLQDNLGEFNDLSVQQADLMAALNGALPRGEGRMLCAAAIGGLVAQLHAQQRVVRRAFASAFAAFAKKKNVRLYRALFGK